jgi:SOS-response transcriptional repressor LexA
VIEMPFSRCGNINPWTRFVKLNLYLSTTILDKARKIAERLAEWAKSVVGPHWGWQKRTADLLGMSPAQLNNLVSGRKAIGPGTRERLAGAGADVEWIMTGVTSNKAVMPPAVTLSKIPVYRLRGEEGKGYSMREHPAEHLLTEQLDDPTLFGVLMPDTSMHPDVARNDVVVVSKQREVASGDLVFVQLKDSTVLVRRYAGEGPTVVLTSADARHFPPLMLKRSDVKSIWKVVQRIQKF